MMFASAYICIHFRFYIHQFILRCPVVLINSPLLVYNNNDKGLRIVLNTTSRMTNEQICHHPKTSGMRSTNCPATLRITAKDS